MQKRMPWSISAGRLSRCRGGMGLVEVAISSVLVGGVVVASLEVVGAVYRTREVTAAQQKGPALAQELLAEILAMPYIDPQDYRSRIGINSGELASSRATFDDIDDYHNWDSPSAVTRSGTPIPGAANWRRQVTVTWAHRYSGGAWSSYDTQMKRITVTVTSPGGEQTTLVALRSDEGSLQEVPTSNVTVTACAGVTLQIGPESTPVRGAVHLSNQAVDQN